MTAMTPPRPRAGDPRNLSPWLLPGALVAVAVAVAALGFQLGDRTSAAEQDAAVTADVANTVTAQRDATASQAVDLAQLVRDRCQAGLIADTDLCSAAAVVRAQPVPEVMSAPGAVGPAGERGVPGLSPPCLSEPAQCRGSVGSPGPTGPAGPPGSTGPQGPAGVDGLDGESGAGGQDGRDGVDGAAGAPGPSGPAGPAGCDAGLVRDEAGGCAPAAPAG